MCVCSFLNMAKINIKRGWKSSTSGKGRQVSSRQTLLITTRRAGRKLPFGDQKSWAELSADLELAENWSSGPAKKRKAQGFQVGPATATPWKKRGAWNRPVSERMASRIIFSSGWIKVTCSTLATCWRQI